MDSLKLHADSRDILGKKVRFLRRQGITPVHVIGHGIDSLSLQCDTVNLRQVLGQAGSTKLVSLKVGKERKNRSVLVKKIQVEPMSGEVLHVDFYEISMQEKVKMEVPVKTIGESALLKIKGNILVQDVHALSVECLAADIPDHFEINMEELVEVGQTIRVRDIVVADGVTVFNDGGQMVLKIVAQAMPKEDEEEEAEAVLEGGEVAAEAEAETGTAESE
jgi:large subunit ribosomal protein L25